MKTARSQRGGVGRSIVAAAVAGVAAVAMAGVAQAQPGLSQPPWRRLQQGFEDVEPLARSLAIQPVDFRAPVGFEDVYDLGDGRLARIDGGLIAVFPRSTYVRDASGVYPTIPPGTVFYVGMPPGIGRGPDDAFGDGRVGGTVLAARNAGRGPDRRAVASRLVASMPPSTRADSRGVSTDLRPRISDGPASIFGGEAERRRLVGELLGRAREATR
jgi:hypothetical protein